VGRRAGLDAVAKREKKSPCLESTSGRPAPSSVTVLTEVGAGSPVTR